MLTIDALKQYGANTEEGLGRCFGNEALYLKLVGTIPGEARFDQLKEAAAGGDLAAAFEAAHALKGVLGNLSLDPRYRPVCEITELLREKKEVDYAPYLEEILSKRDELAALL